MLWIHPGETRGVIVGRLLDPEGRPWQGVALNLLGDNDTVVATTWSYLGDPDDLANPDEGFAENFVFSDVRPGEYVLETLVQDVEYHFSMVVTAGELRTIEIITDPFKTPTPSPELTPVPTMELTLTPSLELTPTPTPETSS